MNGRDGRRFRTGSGCYKCHCCGRMTRSTDNSNEYLDLCYQCYELAGYENMISDAGGIDNLTREGPDEVRRRIRSYIAEIERRGGDVSQWKNLAATAENG